MKIVLVLLAFLASVVVASAQELSPRYFECMGKSSTQLGNNRCAAEELKMVEGELNNKYSRALVVAANIPEAVANIKAAKVRWEAFVAAYIDALFPLENKQQEYGTSYGSKVAIWRVRLAHTQLVVLDDLIAQYAPPK